MNLHLYKVALGKVDCPLKEPDLTARLKGKKYRNIILMECFSTKE